jgi:hypothetical protein
VSSAPSIAIAGWNSSRLPTTDEARAPRSVSWTLGDWVGGADADAPADGSGDGVGASVGVNVALGKADAAGGGGAGRSTTAKTTIAIPTRTPAPATIGSQPGRPPPSATAEVERCPEDSIAGVSVGVEDGNVVPQERQNVRDVGFTVRQAGQTTDGSVGSIGTVDGVTTGGVRAGVLRVWAAGPESSTGSPSHSRKAPHEPQNWSPAAFAAPQRRQTRVGPDTGPLSDA